MPIYTPDWVKDAVFYQIFPDRFARGRKIKKSKRIEDWDSPASEHGFKGGDLYGVIEQLDYLEDLGVNAIYLTPVFSSTSNHRYNTHDYYQVDPMLGGNEALKALIKAVHKRRMKIILDGSFNHTGRSFFAFADIVENGEESCYKDWYNVMEFPINAFDYDNPPNYWAWWSLHGMPKLNHSNSEVKEYIFGVAEHWVREGIDGWRLDVPAEINVPHFWVEFHGRLKTVNPDAYIVGEIWGDAGPWLTGNQFDGVMNYLFAEKALSYCGSDELVEEEAEDRDYHPNKTTNGISYLQQIDHLLTMYPWAHQLCQFNLLNSHDTARVKTMLAGNTALCKLAATLLLTFPGTPALYYGEEIGLEGGRPDYKARESFPWENKEQWNSELLEHYKSLIQIRKKYSALRDGFFKALYGNEYLTVFARQNTRQCLLIALNRGPSVQRILIPCGTVLKSGSKMEPIFPIVGDPVSVANGYVYVEIEPMSSVIYAPKTLG